MNIATRTGRLWAAAFFFFFFCSLLLAKQEKICRDSDLQNACAHFLLREELSFRVLQGADIAKT